MAMEVYGNSVVAEPSNVIFLSTILNREGPVPSHKCDRRCRNEHVFGNMYRCKPTGITHICDKNCNQRIVYDNVSSLCRVSGQLFPLSPAEVHAVRGVRRKFEVESSEGCAFKRRRGAQLHPSPFERSISDVSPICAQIGEGLIGHASVVGIFQQVKSVMVPSELLKTSFAKAGRAIQIP